jgi:uncharacterized glyoxalase superfamily protein PhnB
MQRMAPLSEKTVTVIPALRYRDADAAIAWLKNVLGFEELAVYRDGDGKVAHAELTLGNGMIMLGSVDAKSESLGWYKQPGDIGNAVTGSTYVIVPDCAPAYARVQAMKSEILMELKTMDYGGGSFTVRDPEGHVWSVGEYDPWAAPAA